MQGVGGPRYKRLERPRGQTLQGLVHSQEVPRTMELLKGFRFLGGSRGGKWK